MIEMRRSDSPGGRGLRLETMLLISFAIHIVILSGGAFVQVSSTPRMTFGPVYSVQLVGMGAVLKGSAPMEGLSRDIAAADSRDRTVVLRKPSDASPKVPIQRMESPSAKNPQIARALEEIRKRAGAEPSAGTPGATAQTGQASAGGGGAFNEYYRVIWSRIKSQWALPGGILPKANLIAVVHVRILRNGALTEIYLDQRSGNAYFDNSALRAVNKSNPLPPLPEWFRESSLDIGVRFHSAEFR